MAKVGNLLGKVTDPMTIMIRAVGLTARYFLFLRKFLKFLLFFGVNT